MSSIGLMGALLAGACGGETSGGSESISTADGETVVLTTTVASGATLKLFNLPSEKTSATSASITYELDAPAVSSNTVVACRLNTYTPIVCPNPFRLGQRSELPAGVHTVQYYVDTGNGVNPAKPDASYSWTIEVAASSTGGTSSSQTATVTTPVAGALPAAPTPVPTAVSGSSAQWDGRTAIVVNGVQMMAPVADPSGSGRTVNLHRITQGGASISGGVRSEQLWIGKAAQALTPGKDIWMSFAVQRKADETFGSSTGDDAHLVFQTHTPQPGDTQPDIALVASGQSGTMGWHVAYNTSGTVDGQGWMSTEGKSWVHKEALPAPGVWYRYVVHYRPGYVSSHSPLLEVWRAKPGGAYEKIVNHTGFNTYNTSATGAGASYPRIGLYKYSGSVWTTSSVAWYLTPLYFGTGADLLEAGKAALVGM